MVTDGDGTQAAEAATSRASSHRAWVVLALVVLAVALRVVAAWMLPRIHPPLYAGAFYFPDSEIYWKLGLQLYHGRAYTDGARAVVRTPGYPAFLAVAMRLVGPEPARVRVVQAVLAGGGCCLLLYLLWRRLLDERLARVGLALIAVYPPAVLLSVLMLSEALFTLWLAAQLWALVELWKGIREDGWDRPDSGRRAQVIGAAFAAGLAGGLAALTRPVWLPVVPVAGALLLWALVRARRRAQARVRLSDAAAVAIMLCALVLICFPWWARNRLVTGHWVLGSLWAGASLYDGLNPRATGASDMRFFEQPEAYGLDPQLAVMAEYEQDLYLRRKAFEFLRQQPRRAVWLAWRKQLRFWSIVPHAAGWSAPPLRYAAAVGWSLLYVAILVGAWRCRPVGRWFLVLAGPLLYTALVHLLFVGSIRYREPVLLPVLVLAAAAVIGRPSERQP